VESDGQFTDDLAQVLYELDTSDLPTAHVTAAITRQIVRWAHERGWSVRTEGRVDVTSGTDSPNDARLGFVDVLIRRGVPRPDVAIEIDSTDKPWSVVKLQHAAAGGMHGIWVRWGDEAWAGVYDEIDVIQLPTLRRTGSRSVQDQLRLWDSRRR
jgi:hypothetical protein